MSKYIEICETCQRDVHRVQTKRHKELLGYIKLNTDWNHFTFRPDPDTEFDFSCLLDISKYALELDVKRAETG